MQSNLRPLNDRRPPGPPHRKTPTSDDLVSCEGFSTTKAAREDTGRSRSRSRGNGASRERLCAPSRRFGNGASRPPGMAGVPASHAHAPPMGSTGAAAFTADGARPSRAAEADIYGNRGSTLVALRSLASDGRHQPIVCWNNSVSRTAVHIAAWWGTRHAPSLCQMERFEILGTSSPLTPDPRNLVDMRHWHAATEPRGSGSDVAMIRGGWPTLARKPRRNCYAIGSVLPEVAGTSGKTAQKTDVFDCGTPPVFAPRSTSSVLGTFSRPVARTIALLQRKKRTR